MLTYEERYYAAMSKIKKAFKRSDKKELRNAALKGGAYGLAAGAGVGVLAKGIHNRRKGEKFFKGTGKAALVGGGTGAVVGAGVGAGMHLRSSEANKLAKLKTEREGTKEARAKDFLNRKTLKDKLKSKDNSSGWVDMYKHNLTVGSDEEINRGYKHTNLSTHLRNVPIISGPYRKRYTQSRWDERAKKKARDNKRKLTHSSDSKDADEAIAKFENKK